MPLEYWTGSSGEVKTHRNANLEKLVNTVSMGSREGVYPKSRGSNGGAGSGTHSWTIKNNEKRRIQSRGLTD